MTSLRAAGAVESLGCAAAGETPSVDDVGPWTAFRRESVMAVDGVGCHPAVCRESLMAVGGVGSWLASCGEVSMAVKLVDA